jgi:hypothetical protein
MRVATSVDSHGGLVDFKMTWYFPPITESISLSEYVCFDLLHVDIFLGLLILHVQLQLET